MDDFSLNPKSVERLLPSDIFDELFSKNVQFTENKNLFDNGDINSYREEIITGTGATGAAESFPNQSLMTHAIFNYEGFEENVQHVLPKQQPHSWAQIVKGEPSAYFPQSMVSSVDMKEISLNMEPQQSAAGGNSNQVYQGFKKNEHILARQEAYPWAQNVKGEASSRGTGVYFPQSLLSSSKSHTPLNKKPQQSAKRNNKKSGKMKQVYRVKTSSSKNETLEK